MPSSPAARALPWLLAAAVLSACAPASSTAAPAASAASSAPTTSAPATSTPTSAVPTSATPTSEAPTTAPTSAAALQPDPAEPPTAGETGTAAAALAGLAVAGRAPKTGYDRDAFGQAWADVDRNGCDTRNDVLRRDLTAVQVRPGTQGCVVLTGTLADPYSGTAIAFVRGAATSSAVQVDHVVALSDAWQTGAQGWDTATRTAFANDPLELLAVDGPLNQRKGDGDAATWLPPAKGFRCAYVARQIAVKARYGLWVKPAERDAMDRVLAGCPGQPLPGSDTAAPVVRTAAPEPAAPSPVAPAPVAPAPVVPAPVEPAPQPAAAGVSYANCAAVRAAGAAPLHRGEPGYAAKLDRDDDGIACE
ncbi:GmrSD restriction endonuclease domain-containing protein [Kineococcus rubinsiae]|uniref:GmrSD restriction endonuclease domain-containing protein n=1 Tax=Kineococcus rubinsiae TaxID=2609562 RepID=UPI00142FCCF0|nr:DUF1524 domain-containing protein [Kineococcus rubinsiae]NIZ93122.1 DUF1524 domain-containing protein [Kineococcus rubinsiae]